MATSGDENDALPPVVFGRPGKRRKMYRQRAETKDEDDTLPPSSDNKEQTVSALPPAADTKDEPMRDEDDDAIPSKRDRREDEDREADERRRDDEDDDEDGRGGALAVAELLRMRKMRRPKVGGVEFRSGEGGTRRPREGEDSNNVDDGDDDDMELDLADPIAMAVRFAPQTGLVGDLVNKHMEEYVEAEMAKRYKAGQGLTQTQNKSQAASSGSGAGSGAAASSGAPTALTKESRQQLAMKGKLHEIDLGAEARALNIAMTERATQKLRASNGDGDGDGNGTQSDFVLDKNGKPKLGRNGKPIRRRRGSDDIKRDQLVEQFLHENPTDVDVYNVAKEPTTTIEGRPNDDRIAEQFRREFMETVAQRLRRKRRPLGPVTKPKPRNEEEILKGPKLGGSRNVRSVMRDKLLQKQEEKRQSIPKYEQQLQEQRRRAIRRR